MIVIASCDRYYILRLPPYTRDFNATSCAVVLMFVHSDMEEMLMGHGSSMLFEVKQYSVYRRNKCDICVRLGATEAYACIMVNRMKLHLSIC